jgi:hypothetical protein
MLSNTWLHYVGDSIAHRIAKTVYSYKRYYTYHKTHHQRILEKAKEEAQNNAAIIKLKHEWREAQSEEVDTAPLTIGGKTDFWSQRGWWPFISVEVKTAHSVSANKKPKIVRNVTQLPLRYLGSLHLDGRKADFFYGVANNEDDKIIWKVGSSELYQEIQSCSTWFDMSADGELIQGCYALIFEDSVGPNWVERKSLMKRFRPITALYDDENLTAHDWNDGNLLWASTQYVPDVLYPAQPIWFSKDFCENYPGYQCVAQIYSGVAGINSFEEDQEECLYILWDGKNSFKIFRCC